MKHFFLILGIFLSLNLFGQRDTLDYHFAVDYDTIYYEVDGADTTITYQKNINQNQYFDVILETNTGNYLDSVLTKKANDIESIGVQVEAIYMEFQRQNTILWNLKKEFAKIEEIIDELYTP